MTATNTYAATAFKLAAMRAIALRNHDPISAAIHEESIVALADACIHVHARPCAANGFTSYRAKGRYGWIMIGAKNNEDAAKQASRSSDAWTSLQVWNGTQYVAVTP